MPKIRFFCNLAKKLHFNIIPFFSFSVGGLSTDLQCYFGCDESFKKDYQLHLHLKLKHRNEDPKELEKAYEAAEEEIGKVIF